MMDKKNQDSFKQTIIDNKMVMEITTNRFTYDLVYNIKELFPINTLLSYNFIEFNLEQVKMIDSTSLGYLFDLHNKLKNNNAKLELVVGSNHELKDLLNKFQVDLVLQIR